MEIISRMPLGSIAIISLLIGCVTTKAEPVPIVLRSLSRNIFVNGVTYKQCPSFLVGQVLYHHSGKIWDLGTMQKVLTTINDAGETVDIFEGANGLQIYMGQKEIDISSADISETLVVPSELMP